MKSELQQYNIMYKIVSLTEIILSILWMFTLVTNIYVNWNNAYSIFILYCNPVKKIIQIKWARAPLSTYVTFYRKFIIGETQEMR